MPIDSSSFYNGVTEENCPDIVQALISLVSQSEEYVLQQLCDKLGIVYTASAEGDAALSGRIDEINTTLATVIENPQDLINTVNELNTMFEEMDSNGNRSIVDEFNTIRDLAQNALNEATNANTNFSTLNAAFTNLQTSVNTAIADLSGRVTALESGMGALGDRVTALEGAPTGGGTGDVTQAELAAAVDAAKAETEERVLCFLGRAISDAGVQLAQDRATRPALVCAWEPGVDAVNTVTPPAGAPPSLS